MRKLHKETIMSWYARCNLIAGLKCGADMTNLEEFWATPSGLSWSCTRRWSCDKVYRLRFLQHIWWIWGDQIWWYCNSFRWVVLPAHDPAGGQWATLEPLKWGCGCWYVCWCIIYNIIQYKYQKVWVYLITITYTWNIWYKEDSIGMPMSHSCNVCRKKLYMLHPETIISNKVSLPDDLRSILCNESDATQLGRSRELHRNLAILTFIS